MENDNFFIPTPMPEKDRPIGVSGLMRVKDEEEFVEACIDSVIDVLDELVICYQECSDDTPNILKRKQEQYPDKIKLYFYAPKLYVRYLSPEEKAYADQLPDNSIHLVSNYYNYTLSKATYRYALKIDADQIYFTDKMRELCDAYRSDKRTKITKKELLSYKCLALCCRAGIKKYYRPLSFLIKNFETNYWQYVLKMITNEKRPVWLCGIQLHRVDKTLLVGTKHRHNEVVSLYSGRADAEIFEITPNTWYYRCRDIILSDGWIESFHSDENAKGYLHSGFIWFHMQGCKETMMGRNMDIKPISYDWFRRVPSYVIKRTTGIWELDGYESYFTFFHDNFRLPDMRAILKIKK